MNKTSKYILVGVGVLALVGIGFYAMASSRKNKALLQQNAALQKPNALDVANNVVDKLMGRPEIAQQRLENRRLRNATRQAKLLKKGKIRIEDLQALQNV